MMTNDDIQEEELGTKYLDPIKMKAYAQNPLAEMSIIKENKLTKQ